MATLLGSFASCFYSLSLTLTDTELKELNEVSQISLGSPHEVIAGSQQMIHGLSIGQVELKHPVA